MVFNIIILRKYNRRNRLITIYICAGASIGFIVYLVLGISDDYSPIFTAAILLYYLLLYIRLSTIDTLTGLFNRQAYYQDLETRGSKFEGVISVDMNELKYLNDNFGHDAGDEALRTIAGVLENYSGENAIPYRVGGDEFIILYANASAESLLVNISNMKDMLSKTKYSCAFGYAINNANDIHSALIEADAMMYEDKKHLKEEKEKNGEVLHLRED